MQRYPIRGVKRLVRNSVEAQIGRDEAGPKIDRSFFVVNETDNERERRNKSEPATSHIAMRFRKSNP